VSWLCVGVSWLLWVGASALLFLVLLLHVLVLLGGAFLPLVLLGGGERLCDGIHLLGLLCELLWHWMVKLCVVMGQCRLGILLGELGWCMLLVPIAILRRFLLGFELSETFELLLVLLHLL
jgi:hypothetical protein